MPALRTLSLFAATYALSMMYRTLSGTLEPSLRAELAIDSSSMGLLSSAYFLSFGLVQLPLGLLLDHYGPKFVQIALMLLATLGAFFFAQSTNLESLFLSRLLIGLGCSAGLMAGLKAMKICLPHTTIPLAAGAYLSLGAFGGLCAGTPAEISIRIFGWRETLLLLSAISALSAIALFLFVPTDKFSNTLGTKSQKPYLFLFLHDMKEQTKELAQLYRNPKFYIPLPFAAISQGAILAVHGLWLPLWVARGLDLGEAAAAKAVSLSSLGFLLGFSTTALIATKLPQRVHPFAMPIACSVILCLLQALILQGAQPLFLFIFLFGLCGAGITLAYSALTATFSQKLTGRVNTGLNFGVFMVSFLTQSTLGVMIEALPLPYPQALHLVLWSVVAVQILGIGATALLYFFERDRAVNGNSRSSK